MGRKAIKLTRSEMLEKAKNLSIKNIKKLTNKELMVLVAYDEIDKVKRKMMKTILKKDLRKLSTKLGVSISSKDSKSNMIEKIISTVFAKPVEGSSSINIKKANDNSDGNAKHLQEPINIPERYNMDKIKAYPINPEWAYIYWELSDRTIERIKDALSRGAKLVLRLYDITFVDFDGRNANKIMQNDVSIDIKGWYVKHQQPDADYIAELGLLYSNGDYDHFLRSNVFHSPRNAVSDDTSEKWIDPKEVISLRKKGVFNPLNLNSYNKLNAKSATPLSIEYLYTESSVSNILRIDSSRLNSSFALFGLENYE